jgi:hypothetical protein
MHHADKDDNYHSLIIGYIPSENESEVIATGDPSGSETLEIYVEIYKDFASATGQKNNFSLKRLNIFSEGSKFWSELAAHAEKQLTRGKQKLAPKDLAYCFLRPQGEVFGNDDICHVASPDDCGEFHNDDGEHSGKYYVKYQFFDDGDYLDENVYVIQ